MKIDEAISLINEFWTGDLPFIRMDSSAEKERIQSQFITQFPAMLAEYIETFVPSKDVCFETVGNPMTIYCCENLGIQQDGYSYDPVSEKNIQDWDRNWFLFADEGGDPVIIDLSKGDGVVFTAMHGCGEWEFDAVADSIGQFLLCHAALHHALYFWGPDCIIDGEDGFNLAQEPSQWLFPRMKEWAGSYNEDWCSVFDNYNKYV